MEMERLYSKRLNAGRRTYFFDVKKGRDGTSYLVITEQRDDMRNRLMVFEDRVDEFVSALQEVISKMK
ncbi:MAG: PUR family DNA/RNA-binding protein [Aquificaceae bacterium]|nr:PUR family DNA/RNA-binding protein [Aquificaceae bacterium]